MMKGLNSKWSEEGLKELGMFSVEKRQHENSFQIFERLP